MKFDPLKIEPAASPDEINRVSSELYRWFTATKQIWDDDFKRYLTEDRREVEYEILEEFMLEYKPHTSFQKFKFMLFGQKVHSLAKLGFIQAKSSKELEGIIELLKEFPLVLSKEQSTDFVSFYLPELSILAARRGAKYLEQLLVYSTALKEKERVLLLEVAIIIGHLADHFDLEYEIELVLIDSTVRLLIDEYGKNDLNVKRLLGFVDNHFIGFFDSSQGIYNSKIMEQSSPLYHILVTTIQFNKKYIFLLFDYLESRKGMQHFADNLARFAENYRKELSLFQNILTNNQRKVLNLASFRIVMSLDLIGGNDEVIRDTGNFIKQLISTLDTFEPIYMVKVCELLSLIGDRQRTIPVLNKAIIFLSRKETESVFVQDILNNLVTSLPHIDKSLSELILSRLPKEVENALIITELSEFWQSLVNILNLSDMLEESGIDSFMQYFNFLERQQNLNKTLKSINTILAANDRNGHLHLKVLQEVEAVYAVSSEFSVGTTIPPKIGTYDQLVQIFDKMSYNDALNLIKHKGIERLLKSVFLTVEPMASLISLNHHLDSYKLIDRRYLVEVSIILQSIFFSASEKRDLDISLGYALKIVNMIPIENRLTFIQEDLSRLFRILMTEYLETRLNLLLEVLTKLENKRLSTRLLNKIVPVLYQHFGKEPVELKQSLLWAVDIYNKNGDESLIFTRLERKMVFQIETVGKRMSSVPRIIAQMTDNLGIRESRVEEFIKMLKAIALKFSKLEMMMPQQRIGSSRLVVGPKKGDDQRLIQIIERFLRDGIQHLVYLLSTFPTISDLFNEEGNYTLLNYLDRVMPLDTITQEDLNVAFGSKPVLFEQRGLLFVNQIFPNTVILFKGIYVGIVEALTLIINHMEQQYCMVDVSSRWFPRFCQSLIDMNIKNLARREARNLNELHSSLHLGFESVILEDDDEKATKAFSSGLDKITKEEHELFDLETACKASFRRLMGNISLHESTSYSINQFLQVLVHEINDVVFIKGMIDNFSLKEFYREWSKNFTDIDDLIVFYTHLVKGEVIDRFAWLKHDPWYINLINETWSQKGGIKFLGSENSKREYFENHAGKLSMIAAAFHKWADQNLGQLGVFLMELLSLGIQANQIFDLLTKMITYGDNYPIPIDSDNTKQRTGSKSLFFKRFLAELPHLRSDLSRLRESQRLKQFEVLVYKMIAEKIDEQVLIMRISDDCEFLNIASEKSIIDFLKNQIKAVPKPRYYPSLLLFVLYSHAISDLKKLIPIPEDIGREVNKLITTNEYHELEKTCDYLTKKLSELAISNGLVSKEIADKIQAEMAEKQREDINLLSMLMEFTLDPSKESLLSVIEDNDEVMDLLKTNYEILLLVRQKSHHPSLPEILESNVGNPNLLQSRLKTL